MRDQRLDAQLVPIGWDMSGRRLPARRLNITRRLAAGFAGICSAAERTEAARCRARTFLISLSSRTRRPTFSTPRFLSRAAGLASSKSASIAKRENLADEAVNAIASGVLASADDALDDLDYVRAADGSKIALGPFRQDVNGEVAAVFLG